MVQARNDVTRRARSGNRSPRWRITKHDLVFGLGIVTILWGAAAESPYVSGALIGVGPVLIGWGLGVRKDRR